MEEKFTVVVNDSEFVVQIKSLHHNMYHFEFFGAELNDRGNRTWVEFSHNVTDKEEFAKRKIGEMVEENRIYQQEALQTSLAQLEKLIAKFKVSGNLTSLYENLTGKKLADIAKLQDLFISWLRRKYAKQILEQGIVWETLFRRFINDEHWEESEIPEYKIAQNIQDTNRREILIAEIQKFTGVQISPQQRKEWIKWVKETGDNSEHPLVSWEKFNSESHADIMKRAIAGLGELAEQLAQIGKKKLNCP